MIKKVCTRCHRASYSSSNYGPWDCPICNEDLTNSAPLPIHSQELHIPKKKVIKTYIKNKTAL
ncbi:hypothetical protein DYE48_07590 [Halobacillus trueperi]|uniref:C2H2-type domain-containing protein n=1 Tax=Halobacillus trueperi TaxID=156205 RepID=A0A3E0JAP9_9BACI|nr:hypothetical protein DYE48_07590 [Halobacillus trueperi]